MSRFFVEVYKGEEDLYPSDAFAGPFETKKEAEAFIASIRFEIEEDSDLDNEK